MAKWTEALNDNEKQDVEAIRAARERLKARDAEYTARIKRIMNRAIRRIRRSEGKQ